MVTDASLQAACRRSAPLETRPGIETRGLAQLLVELFLAIRQRRLDHDGELGIEVARAAAGLGQALAGHAKLLAALRSCRYLHCDVAFERRDLHLGAER